MSRLINTMVGELFQGVLPTPKIRSVSLKLSPLPPPVNNPHIDHVRETVIYKGRDGKRKFAPSQAAGITKDPRNLLVEVSVVLLDIIEDNGDSRWFKNQNLMKYLRLQIVHSEDPDFTAKLTNKEISPIPSQINKFKKMDNRVVSTIVALDTKIDQFYEKQRLDKEIREFVQKFTFAVNTTTPEHLTYFANVYLDTEQMMQDYSLDLPVTMLGQACSDTTVEEVYKNKSLVRTASIYQVSGTDSIYPGNAYNVGGGKYIANDIINDDMISMDLFEVLNAYPMDRRATKLNKYRRKIEKILNNNQESKYVQMVKLLSQWSDRSGNAKSAALYRILVARKKIYDSSIQAGKTLTRRTVSNPTIRDQRTIQDLSNITITVEDTDESMESVKDIRTRNNSTTSEAAAQNLKNALYFSNIMFARDNANSARLTFFIDWRKMIMKNSKYAGLLKNDNLQINETLRSQVKIKSVSLIRERQDEKGVIEQGDHRHTRDRDSVRKLITRASETNSGIRGTRMENSPFKKKDRPVGAMKEMKLTDITTADLRAFEAVDYDISEKTSGKYKYRVEFSMVDNIGSYLAQRAKELSSAKEELKQYYGISTMKCNYNIASEKFTEFFISALYQKYSIPSPDTMAQMTPEELNMLLNTSSPLEAPWMKPIAKYVEILNLFGNITDSDGESLAKKMYLKVEPSTGSPDGILEVIKQFEDLESKIAEVLGVTLTDIASIDTTNSKIKSILKDKIVISYLFKDELDCSSLSSVKARFLEYTNSSDLGLSYITAADLTTRIVQDEAKYFKNTPSLQQNALADMGTYRFSYLSPSYLQVGGKRLELLNRGESLYDPQQYKEMMFSISLLKTNPAARSMTMPVLAYQPTDLQQSTAASAQLAGMNMQALQLLSNYGIIITNQVPASSVTSIDAKPLQDVRDILGENTLLAINNAIRTSSDEDGEDDTQVTQKLNSEVIQADATAFASSLINTLVNVGMANFSGVNSDVINTKEFNPLVKQQIEASKTLDFYNMSNPINGIDSRIRSSNSKSSADSDAKIRTIPNQIKSLFLVKSGQVSPVKNWFEVDTDPMANPELRPLFELLYFNIQKIEVLTGFTKTKDSKTGEALLRAPSFKLLTPDMMAKKGSLLCRLKKYQNDSLHIGQTDMIDLPVVNEYFILKLTDASPQLDQNPIVQSDLTTDGGEYKLPNGTNYIGKYHIHKDGTVMTGASMGTNESILTPLKQTVGVQARASAYAAQNLAGITATYQKQILQGLVSHHYDQISVESDYCSTGKTITSAGGTTARSTAAYDRASMTYATVSTTTAMAPSTGVLTGGSSGGSGGGGY
tara:strand:- start:8992 stop:12963 length:3972 start_codon:yes stop_codon:yes gene_type:complete